MFEGVVLNTKVGGEYSSPRLATGILTDLYQGLEEHFPNKIEALWLAGPAGADSDKVDKIQQTIGQAVSAAMRFSPDATSRFVGGKIRQLTTAPPSNLNHFLEGMTKNILFIPDIIDQPLRLETDGTVSYFGTTFELGLTPEEIGRLEQITCGIFVLRDEQGQVTQTRVLNPYYGDAGLHPAERSLDQLTLFGFSHGDQPSSEELTQFLSQISGIQEELRQIMPQGWSTNQYHLSNYYYLWQYCRSSNPENLHLPTEVATLLQTVGDAGLDLFQTKYLDPNQLPEVIDTLIAYPESQMLERYSSLLSKAASASSLMSENEETSLDLSDLICRQTTQLLVAAHRVRQGDPHFIALGIDLQLINDAFDKAEMLVDICIDPTQEITQDQHVSNQTILNLIHLMNSSHPSEASGIFDAFFRTWQLGSILRQSNLDFSELNTKTAVFYRLYESISRDPNKITASATHDVESNLTDFKTDVENGIIRPDDRIGFLGCGPMDRCELDLIKKMWEILPNLKAEGFDPFVRPASPDVAYYPYANQDLINHPELHGQFAELFALGSSMMDILGFLDRIQAGASAALTLRVDGILCDDQAWPYGGADTSYQPNIVRQQQENPQDLSGIFHRLFTGEDGTAFGKPFFAALVEEYFTTMQRMGFSPLNFPNNSEDIHHIAALCNLDDDFIGDMSLEEYLTKPIVQSYITEHKLSDKITDMLALAKQGLYRTQDGERSYNRFRIRWQKAGEIPKDRLTEMTTFNAILRQLHPAVDTAS